MATTNPIVTDIEGYVNQESDKLLSKSILGAESTKLFALQSGVKGNTAIHLMDTTIEFGDGSDCGWDETGETKFTNRIIEAKPIKVNMAFCDKKLLKTYAQHQVRVAAGQETLPFQEKWVNSIVDGIGEKLEQMIYFGTGSGVEFEGIVPILNGDANTIKVSVNSGDTAYALIKAVAKAIPAAVKNPVILVGKATYREYMQDLVGANLYHYDPANGDNGYKLPGTDIKVIGVAGLDNATTYAIGASLENLVYGTDMEGDNEKFDLWYSKDNREFRLDVEFIAGVQTAFPEEVVLGTR